jgi:hypothetical protein
MPDATPSPGLMRQTSTRYRKSMEQVRAGKPVVLDGRAYRRFKSVEQHTWAIGMEVIGGGEGDR